MKKAVLVGMITVMGCGMASAQMPNMNATDHVYGYHLRDVYKDMEAMKYDDTKLNNKINELYNTVDNIKPYDDTNLKNDMADLNNKVNSIKPYDDSKLKEDMNGLSNKLDTINSRGDVLANSVADITTDIANNSNRVDRMENTFNNSITNISNDVGVLKNDMADSKHNINSLVATTDKLNHHVSSLHSDVSALRGDLSKLKSDTHKGLAQANALSGLKYLGGKGLQLSIALGGYRGQSAIAYGMFYGVNDDLMLYAGGTDDSYNASINVRIGGK